MQSSAMAYQSSLSAEIRITASKTLSGHFLYSLFQEFLFYFLFLFVETWIVFLKKRATEWDEFFRNTQ